VISVAKRWCGDCKNEVVFIDLVGEVAVYYCRKCEKYWFVGKQVVFSLKKEELDEVKKKAN